MIKKNLKSLIGLATTGLILSSIGLLTDAALPKPAAAAEEVRLTIGGPFVFSVSIDSIETFAETGEIADDLRLVTRFIGEDTLNQIRQSLRAPIPYSVTQIDNILYSNLGQDALQNLGKIIQPDPTINGFRGIRGAFITAAAQAGPEGWTLIDVMRAFPTKSIDVSGGDLFNLKQTLDLYFSYNTAVVEAIQAEAATAAAKQAPANIDRGLEEPGPYQFEQSTLTLTNSALRQTGEGIRLNYDFNVEMYLPKGMLEPAPLVIISHGFGDIQESFDFLATHLASHGFAVVVPDHVGSDLGVRLNFLQGNLNTILSPTEFISRPQEVSFVISELDRLVNESDEWARKISLDKIGMVGDSLGATTALASAGADINFNRISRACDREQLILNIAQYLLCQARFLPPISSQLSDPRITAAIASHAMGGGLYGPEGIGQIEIPLMMVSGSRDIVAPMAAEQVHPFIWASSEEKYFALLTEGTHFTAKPGRPGGAVGVISALIGENRDVGTRYFKALNVAFWNLYLREKTSYRAYLSSRYGQQLSEGEPLQLDIIQSLTPETLVEAYGEEPPIAIIPEPVTAKPAPARRDESVLDEIQRTGIFKVGLRQDSFPFGYVDDESNWMGYCRTLATDLQEELAQTIDTDINIQLVELASTQENRYGLVRDSHVHLECGPNTIRTDIEGVTFSSPLLVSGTQFLVKRGRVGNKIPPRLAGARVAVLPGTLTEQFIREEFPDAKLVSFPGGSGRSDAVRALENDDVEVFADAGVLALGEAQRQQLPTPEISLLPRRPLTCEFYGLALPAGDGQWQTFIDDFIARTHTERLDQSVPSNLLTDQLDIVDACLNDAST